MRDDLNAIPVFVTVVESGNFASAAAILHVTRSAVGKTIARLEARLGVALFQRTTRRQLLTEEGEQFYLQCREALERIREAEETLQRGKDEVQGRLRVSLPVLFGQRCVAPLLFRLSQRYPLLKLELHYSDRQVNLLEEGFDLAVRIGSLADTGSLRARALGEHGMVLCAAAEYLRQQPAPQTIAGLNEHRTLGYLHNGQLQKWQLYDPQQGEVRFSPQTWLIQDDFAAIAAAVQQGIGIAWLPDWLVAQALADGTLQQVLAPSAQVRFAIHAVWPEGPWLPQKTRAAIDACGKGCLLPQHLVSAERNNRHLWRRRFSDSVQATGALYAIASATRPSGTGGTAVQRAAGDTQHLRRPADVAVDPGQGIDNQLLIMGLQSPARQRRRRGAIRLRQRVGRQRVALIGESQHYLQDALQLAYVSRPRQLAEVNQQRV